MKALIGTFKNTLVEASTGTVKLREGSWATLLQSVQRQGQTTEAGAANQHTTALLQSVHSYN